MKSLFLALSLSFAVVPLTHAGAPAVDYPNGYRNWTHVKSLILEPGHALYATFGGLHHIYANGQAMKGYKTGKFPDGAAIVFDLLEVNQSGNAIAEGPRKIVGVMQRDARRFKETGGWGFEGFAQGDPKQRVVGDQAKAACFGCHLEQAARTGYVFSAWRE
ncbi:MAG: cytochrome P460 family protein [Pseudomonadota bacterium]|nr:cytochrome P460 family protein [Pseudomonadota bacterium]MDP2352648.1 cytochrome P460 family protein [Pseudomonadota bacterium]